MGHLWGGLLGGFQRAFLDFLGDFLSLPANYRPIALLPIGYKVLAALMHQRLIDGGVDQHINPWQFGFRKGRPTADALSIVRRTVDAASQHGGDGLIMLLPDWSKAFDRIKKDSLTHALKRFGLPGHIVNMIAAIYESRRFFIHDHSGVSSTCTQAAGIAQGCPLSPFLFILVQSVMMHDILASVELEAEPPYLMSRTLMYADDTRLMSSSVRNLQGLLQKVVDQGLGRLARISRRNLK